MFCKQTIQHSEDMAKYNDDFAYKKCFCMADILKQSLLFVNSQLIFRLINYMNWKQKQNIYTCRFLVKY